MLRTIVVAVGLLCAFTTPAWAFKDEPLGYGEARFTMSVEQVKKVYPQITLLEAPKVGTTYQSAGIIYALPAQKLAGFNDPVNVTFRFSEDQLWQVRFEVSERDAAVMVDVLTKRHGEPTAGTTNPAWVGEQVAIRALPQLRSFEIVYRSISVPTPMPTPN